MDFGALILTIAAGGIVDVLADLHLGKPPIVPLMGAAFLIVILGFVGRITGQWTMVTIVALLYVIASFLKNWKNVPALSSAITSTQKKG